MRQEVPVLRFLKSQDPHATHSLHLDASFSLPLHLGPQAAFSSSSPHLLAWALCHVQQFTTLSKPGSDPLLWVLWLLLIAFCHCDGMASGTPGASPTQRPSVLLTLYSWASTAPGKIPGTQLQPAGQGHTQPLVLTYPCAGVASLQPCN